MNNETNTYKQILTVLETLQEFVDTNPNEAAVLADSALLIQAIYADLNPKDVAIGDKTSAHARILRLLDTMQEFIDTNPNEVTALADSALLIQAIHADLNPKDVAGGELRQPRICGIA
jgi:ribonuclease HI